MRRELGPRRMRLEGVQEKVVRREVKSKKRRAAVGGASVQSGLARATVLRLVRSRPENRQRECNAHAKSTSDFAPVLLVNTSSLDATKTDRELPSSVHAHVCASARVPNGHSTSHGLRGFAPDWRQHHWQTIPET